MENSNTLRQPELKIENRIFMIRGKQVMLDSHLAKLFETETKQLNRAIKRNKDRFPDRFMFQLTENEYNFLRCQIGTSNINQGRGGRRYLPNVFTEHGVAILPSILHSETAILISIQIIDTFIELRKQKSVHQLIDFNKKSNSLNQLSSPLIPLQRGKYKNCFGLVI